MENYPSRSVRPGVSTDTKETPEQPLAQVQRTFTPASAQPAAPAKGKKSFGSKKWLIGGVIAVVLICGLGWYFMRSIAFGSGIDSGKYQAVFLTSGQVYFGKMQFADAGYVKLTDVFYIQTGTSTDSKNPQTTTDTTNLQLIKLGNEIHGPEDAMIISRDQVLFYENLKSDGKVTQKITEYHNQNK